MKAAAEEEAGKAAAMPVAAGAHEASYSGFGRFKHGKAGAKVEGQLQLTTQRFVFTPSGAMQPSVAFACTDVTEIKRGARTGGQSGALLHAMLQLVHHTATGPMTSLVTFTRSEDASDQQKEAGFVERDRFDGVLRQMGGGVARPSAAPGAELMRKLATAAGLSGPEPVKLALKAIAPGVSL